MKTIQNAINQKILKGEKEKISEKLVLSEERYRYLVQNSPDIIYTLDDEGNFTFVSDAADRLLGFESRQLIGRPFVTIVRDRDIETAQQFLKEETPADTNTSTIELDLKVKDKKDNFKQCEVRHLRLQSNHGNAPLSFSSGGTAKRLRIYGVIRDLSEKKRLESELRHARKMEAVGTLAGGIAHDFNNLLMVIQGHTSIMLLKTDQDHPFYDKLKNIEEYIEKGAGLTRQLLNFARGGESEIRPVNLNSIVRQTVKMFGRTKKDIVIHERYEKDLPTVNADQGQIEQVLLNLFVNASHAMPAGGDLTIETQNVVLDSSTVDPFDLPPGPYVKLSVTDTGMGMDEETRQRIFEPFFTTKEIGQGTGLGLSTAYGIIKKHNGFIDVASKEGKGATFNIFLPVSGKEMVKKKRSPGKIVKGPETVLFVDDEEMIIEIGLEILEALGYNVLCARNGKEAIRIYTSNKDNIDVVLLDLVMPGMSGKETYRELKKINPDINVVVSTGCDIDEDTIQLIKESNTQYIQKPFNIMALSKTLREVLDRK